MTKTLLSRRQMLQAGARGGLGLALPGPVDVNRSLGNEAAEKSRIFLGLCGGPSHPDTWDLKPDAPEGIRSPYKPIATRVPGLRLSELHTIKYKSTWKNDGKGQGHQGSS